MKRLVLATGLTITTLLGGVSMAQESSRPRARDVGIVIGVLEPGALNAITDVKGVLVGNTTVITGEDVRTGVTAILPHGGDLFYDKVPAAIYAGNAFGKLAGSTQVEELGEIETPIVLTNTLSVPTAAEAILEYTLSPTQHARIKSVNPIVGETNDGWLNDIRGRHVSVDHVLSAISNAKGGMVAEGAVGAGTGTMCFGFKGGIGTASRLLPGSNGGYTVGVLVQTNFGGILQINGAPVGRELERSDSDFEDSGESEGSCMIVVATDAPLLSRNLKRLAKRAILGLARTGGYCANGSGDYVIAFSTNEGSRQKGESGSAVNDLQVLANESMSPLFLAVVEATEEAIINSLLKASTVRGRDGHTAQAIPVEKVREICQKYNSLNWDRSLPAKGRR